MRPCSSMSTSMAAAYLPSPGIVMISPQSGTSQPAPVGAYVAHVHRESCRCVEERRIVREREVGLRHADRQFAEPLFREARDPLFGEREKVDVVGAVHPPGDRADFVPEDGKLKRQAAHLLVAGRAGQVQLSPRSALTFLSPGSADRRSRTRRETRWRTESTAHAADRVRADAAPPSDVRTGNHRLLHPLHHRRRRHREGDRLGRHDTALRA